MQLIETIQEVLETGVLPLRLERQIHKLLNSGNFDETELAAIEELLNALMIGTVRPTS